MNEKVLIVDDEQDVVDSLHDLLGEADISSRGETDPRNAITSFQANPTDVVIIDYLLEDTTGITGLEVLAQLREIKPFTRFIMISGWMPREIDDTEAATKMNVDAFVRKPLDTTLVDRVQEFLSSIESKADDWGAIAQEYVSKGTVTAEEVRTVNEEFKQKIIEALDQEQSQ